MLVHACTQHALVLPSLPQRTTANSSWLLANICRQGKAVVSHKMAVSTWLATIVVVQMGGGGANPSHQVGGANPSQQVGRATQHMQYLFLDNLVHHFQGSLQVAVAMASGLRHTGADIHTEHMQVLWQTHVL